MAKTYLVTGGAGFLGSALVRRLVREGHRVRVLDNQTRGSVERLGDIRQDFEFIEADVRDASLVLRAAEGVESVCHLAFINGTEFFYTNPDLVLDVGVKGIVNVISACLAHRVEEFVLVSSSEVYHDPPIIPTDERVPLSIPDPLNPRYSYAAGKIVSEVMAINYGRKHFEHVVIVRPHNVYGPDMGWEHVIPQFILRMRDLCRQSQDVIRFPIQGTGRETRSFVFIDDFIEGLLLAMTQGQHLGIYHVGTTEKVTIGTLAREVAAYFGRQILVVPGEALPGSPPHRCPDISKISRLGYAPAVSLRQGLPRVAEWYCRNAHRQPVAKIR